MKLSIIIPVFNERNHILETISQVEAVRLLENIQKEVIIVDDGSTDGTVEKLKRITGYKVIFLEKNGGKGQAIRAGLAQATGEFTVIQDADLEYDPADFNLLLAEVVNKGAVAVFGSRRLNRANKQYSGVSFYWGGLLVTLFANWLYGINLTDEPTCYKLVRTDILRQMELTCERFEFCPEVVAKLARMEHPILEVPIRYYPRSAAEGKKIKWRDGLEAVQTLWKHRKYLANKPHFNMFDKIIRFMRMKKVLRHLPKGITLLDFGSGREGALLHYLNQKRYVIHGVGVDHFSQEGTQHGIELRCGGLERIGPNEKFDAITMLAVLEHLEEPLIVLKSLHGALADGGRILLTVPSVWSQPVLEFLAFRLKVISEPEIRDHKRYYDKNSLQEILRQAGFRDVKHKYFQFWMNNLVVARK